MSAGAVHAREQARVRTGPHGGEFEEQNKTDQGADALTATPDTSLDHPEEPFDFERIESLVAGRYGLDPQRAAKPPVIKPDDDVYTITRKFIRYTKTSQTPLDGQQISDMLGWPPADPNTVDPAAWAEMATDRTAFLARDGYVFLDRPGQPPICLDLENRFRKTGEYQKRYNPGNKMAFYNASDYVTRHQLEASFREWAASEAPDVTDEEISSLFGQLSRPSSHSAAMRYMYNDTEQFSDGVLETVAVGADLPQPAPVWSSAPEHGDYCRQKQEWEQAVTRIINDDTALGAALANVPTEQHDGQTFYKPNPLTSTDTGWVDRSIRHEKRRVHLIRAYRGFLGEQIQQENDFHAQRAYVERQTVAHSATVFEQKKNIPKIRLAAADQSVFKTSGDFQHVEIDASVDLGRIHKVEAEYGRLKSRLPRTTAPTLRFRKTGRHRALGIYHPHVDNIAVDPYHPAAFWHEYVHHLDFTSGRTNPSSSAEFLPILRGAQRAMNTHPALSTNPKLDYLSAPTEVHSRAAELYLRWKGVETSLNGDDSRHALPEYQVLTPMKPQIIKFFDHEFGQQGAHL